MAKNTEKEKELNVERSIVASNSVYYFFRLISRAFIAFVVSIFLVRYLGATNYGIYTIVTAYWGLFLAVIALGLGSTVQYGIAKYRAEHQHGLLNWLVKHYLKILTLTSIIGSIVMFLVAGPIATAYRTPQMQGLIQVLAMGLLFYSIVENFSLNVYTAFQKLEYSLISGVTFDFLRLLQGTLVVLYFGLAGVIAFYDVLYIIIAIISLYFVYKLFRHNTTQVEKPAPKADLKEFQKYNAFSFVSSLIGYFYGPLIALLLGIISPNLSSVSYYTIGSQMAAIVNMPSGAITASFFATTTKYFQTKQYKKLYNIMSTVLRYTAMITIPLAVGGIVAANQLIVYFFRSALSSAVVPFIIIIVATLLSSLLAPITNVLSAIGKQKYFMYAYGSSAIVALIAMLILIPTHLATGAAAASFLATLTTVFVSLYFVSKYIKIFLPYLAIIKVTIASLIMGVFIYLANKATPLSLLPLIMVAGVVLYIILIYLMRALTKKDIAFFLRLAHLDKLFARVMHI